MTGCQRTSDERKKYHHTLAVGYGLRLPYGMARSFEFLREEAPSGDFKVDQGDIAICDYYYDDVGSEAAERTIAADVTFSDRVQQEDVEICEHVQRGLASRAYDRGRFSVEMERGVYHFQCLLKEAYRRAVSDVRGNLNLARP